MKAIDVVLLLLLVMTNGCSSKTPSGDRVTKECRALQEIMSTNVSLGMTKEALLQFFRARGWDATYGMLDDAYYLRFPYPGKEWEHIVIIKVWLGKGDRVRSYDVSDTYIAP
ncbi:MAG: hypothetical protein FJ399_12025 [Verrucomicrobia bacterium]|nr:hypothetical protein [Verrucomicrobiota bacterium]